MPRGGKGRGGAGAPAATAPPAELEKLTERQLAGVCPCLQVSAAHLRPLFTWILRPFASLMLNTCFKFGNETSCIDSFPLPPCPAEQLLNQIYWVYTKPEKLEDVTGKTGFGSEGLEAIGKEVVSGSPTHLCQLSRFRRRFPPTHFMRCGTLM